MIAYRKEVKNLVMLRMMWLQKCYNYRRKVTLGGMLYDVNLKRGVRKKSLPEPNPQKIELPKYCTYQITIEKAKELYFSERIDEDGQDEG